MTVKNKQFFTTIGKGHGAPCLPATREEWERMRREPWLRQMCERIEKGEEELKHHLPVWTPHCAEFRNNHRAVADAVKPLCSTVAVTSVTFSLKRFLGMLMSLSSNSIRRPSLMPLKGLEVNPG